MPNYNNYEVFIMKKLVSAVLSVIMVLSVCCCACLPVMAADINVISPGDIDYVDVVVKVNGKESMDVVFERDPENPNEITFTYDGTGNVDGWEFEPAVDGSKVTIVKQEGNKITIKVDGVSVDKVVANAIVKDADSGKQPTDDNKSPATGAAAATGLVVAGIGVAILSLTKKRDAE